MSPQHFLTRRIIGWSLLEEGKKENPRRSRKIVSVENKTRAFARKSAFRILIGKRK